MDDPATQGVLLESIETHREHLLYKEEERIQSFRKGKSPATEQDEVREAQLEKQLKDLADHYRSISENEAVARQCKRTGVVSFDKTSVISSQNWPLVAQKDIILDTLESSSEDEEPLWDPLTSSYAHRETGFEAGPSNSRLSSDTPEGGDDGCSDRLKTPTTELPLSQESYTSPRNLPYPVHPAGPNLDDIERDRSAAPSASRGMGRLSFNNILSWVTPRAMEAVWGGKPSDANPAKPSPPLERQEVGPHNDRDNQRMPASPKIRMKKSSTQLGRLEPNLQLDDRDYMNAALSNESVKTSDDGSTSDARLSSDSTISGELNASKRANSSSVDLSDGPTTTLRAQRSWKSLSWAKLVGKNARKPPVINYITLKEEGNEYSSDKSEESAVKEQYLEASRCEAIRLNSIYRQEEQDRALAERLAHDDESVFAIQQSEEQDYLSQYQNEANLIEMQLQADMEFALRLQNESALMESDRALAQRLQSDSSRPSSSLDRTFDNIYIPVINEHPSSQSTGHISDPSARAIHSIFSNGSSPPFATQSSSVQPQRNLHLAFQGSDTKPQQRNENHSIQQGEGQSNSRGISSLRRMLHEENERQARDRAEARRVQNALQAEDQVVIAKFKAEQAEIERKEFAECLICIEESDRAGMLRPCKHWYCRGCLAGAFRNAYNSKPKKLFRCCNDDIPVDLAVRELGAAFVRNYKAFGLERSTPNPLYCSNKSCAHFLPPTDIHGDIGTCRKCRSQTCRHCRSRAHLGKLCSKDKETEKVKELANKQGWKACPGCSHMIMRNEGCLHMTCSQCRTEFCYNCGAKSCRGTCKRT